MARFNVKQKKKNPGIAPNVQKKKDDEKQKIMFDEEEDDDEDDSDDVDMAEEVKTGKKGGQKAAADDDDDDDEEDDDEEDEEEDDDEDDDDEDDEVEGKKGGEEDDDDDDEGGDDDDDDDESEEDDEADVDALMDEVLNKAKGKTPKNQQKTAAKKETPQGKQGAQTPQGKKGKKIPADSPAAQNLKRPAEDDPASGPQSKKQRNVCAIIPSDIAASEQERRDARDKRSLFIKGFTNEVSVEEIKELSADIVDVRKISNVKSGPYAFLEFKSEQVAEKNLKLLKTKTLGNDNIHVDYVGCKSSKNQGLPKKDPVPICLDKLYISGLTPDTTQEDLENAFPTASMIHITKPNKAIKAQNKIAFVSFANEKDAADVYNTSKEKLINGKLVSVFFAKNFPKKRHSGGGGGGPRNGAPFGKKKNNPPSQLSSPISPTEIQREPGLASGKDKGGKFEKHRGRGGGGMNRGRGGGPGGFRGRGGGRGGFGGRGGNREMGEKSPNQGGVGGDGKKRHKKRKPKKKGGGGGGGSDGGGD